MTTPPDEASIQALENLKEAYLNYYRAHVQFSKTDMVGAIRHGWEQRTLGRETLLSIAEQLSDWVNLELLDIFAFLTMVEANHPHASELILSLPREEVIQRIDAAAFPQIEDGIDTQLIFHLYRQLGQEPVERLIQYVSQHPDPDVRRDADWMREDWEKFGQQPLHD